MLRAISFAWVLLTFGCVAPSTSLVVELRTDYVAPSEFVRVETALHESGLGFEAVEQTPIEAMPAGSMRIAEFASVPFAPATISVRLYDAEDQLVAERSVRFAPHASARVVTVILTRNCAGVVCSEGQSCLDGACTDERCTPETPEWCDVALCELAEGLPEPRAEL